MDQIKSSPKGQFSFEFWDDLLNCYAASVLACGIGLIYA